LTPTVLGPVETQRNGRWAKVARLASRTRDKTPEKMRSTCRVHHSVLRDEMAKTDAFRRCVPVSSAVFQHPRVCDQWNSNLIGWHDVNEFGRKVKGLPVENLFKWCRDRAAFLLKVKCLSHCQPLDCELTGLLCCAANRKSRPFVKTFTFPLIDRQRCLFVVDVFALITAPNWDLMYAPDRVPDKLLAKTDSFIKPSVQIATR
jgi:hypothetical protein